MKDFKRHGMSVSMYQTDNLLAHEHKCLQSKIMNTWWWNENEPFIPSNSICELKNLLAVHQCSHIMITVRMYCRMSWKDYLKLTHMCSWSCTTSIHGHKNLHFTFHQAGIIGFWPLSHVFAGKQVLVWQMQCVQEYVFQLMMLKLWPPLPRAGISKIEY